MTEQEEETFPAHLFPPSFTLLYCPFKDCTTEDPFVSPNDLINHVSLPPHNLTITRPLEVIPFLDRYLEARLSLTTELSVVEEMELRDRLQHERLCEVLGMQEQERKTIYKRGRHCLFCPVYCDTLPNLFAHMYQIHSFNIGQLDNLVMVDEFLSSLQAKLTKLTCLYCEGVFPSSVILKKHIKNKNHYRIHPQNHHYDKYYIVNYLRPGKLYDEREDSSTVSELLIEDVVLTDEEREWAELTEPIDTQTSCLFCPHQADSPESTIDHLRQHHSFNLTQLIKESNLDTYGFIKVVNYLRRCYAEVRCAFCGQCLAEGAIEGHLREEHQGPLQLPIARFWDDPQYLFPVYDDDPLLLCSTLSTN